MQTCGDFCAPAASLSCLGRFSGVDECLVCSRLGVFLGKWAPAAPAALESVWVIFFYKKTDDFSAKRAVLEASEAKGEESSIRVCLEGCGERVFSPSWFRFAALAHTRTNP